MWESLLGTFRVIGTITYPSHAAPLLAQYEVELGRSLPHSYKDYCLAFGPGELISPFSYLISAPGIALLDNAAESRTLNQFCLEATQECGHYITNDEDRQRLQHALFFATDISSYCYFWNTNEITSQDTNEYAIYVVKSTCKVHRLCDTFSEFIMNICLSTGIPGDSRTTQRERVFTPRAF